VPTHTGAATVHADSVVVSGGPPYIFHNGMSVPKSCFAESDLERLRRSAVKHNSLFWVYRRDGGKWLRAPDLFVTGETPDAVVFQYKWWL
jgi:hypothetical protein